MRGRRSPKCPSAAICLASVGGVAVARLLRVPNSWTLGSLIGVGVVAALGFAGGQMSPITFALGQFLVGITIGLRLRRELVVRLPWLSLVASVFIIVAGAALLGLAAVLAVAIGTDFASAALALSPGGLSEMSATAQVLHRSVVLVTAFHIVRSLVVNALSTGLWTILDRVGLFSVTRRLETVLFGERPSGSPQRGHS